MIHQVNQVLVRPLVIAVLVAGSLNLAVSLPTTPHPAQAQDVDRAAVVLRWLDAVNHGDLDTAVAQFAGDAFYVGTRSQGNCSLQTPCTDGAGIRQQLQGNIAIHSCSTVLNLQVSGAIVTGERELRTDTTRAEGIDRELQFFMVQVPQDKITWFAGVFDVADPQTAMGIANAGNTQPAGAAPNPPSPCPPVM